MIITMPRADLARELDVVEKIVGRKQTIPILSSVLIEAAGGAEIALSATDLDVGVRTGCAVVTAPGAGSFTLPGKKLADLVKKKTT